MPYIGMYIDTKILVLRKKTLDTVCTYLLCCRSLGVDHKYILKCRMIKTIFHGVVSILKLGMIHNWIRTSYGPNIASIMAYLHPQIFVQIYRMTE